MDASMYNSDSAPPEDLMASIGRSSERPEVPNSPSFGVDYPLGIYFSGIFVPVWMYAVLRGKFQFWQRQISALPDEVLAKPSLDMGCGRGLVALYTAVQKKMLAERDPSTAVAPVYAIDIFNSRYQTGNSAVATYKNAAAMGVEDFVVLHEANFATTLPFATGGFGLVTAGFALHYTSKAGQETAVREMARVCAPGGQLLIVDLLWKCKSYKLLLEQLDWAGVEVQWSGMNMMYGPFPCGTLTATKPLDVGSPATTGQA